MEKMTLSPSPSCCNTLNTSVPMGVPSRTGTGSVLGRLINIGLAFRPGM